MTPESPRPSLWKPRTWERTTWIGISGLIIGLLGIGAGAWLEDDQVRIWSSIVRDIGLAALVFGVLTLFFDGPARDHMRRFIETTTATQFLRQQLTPKRYDALLEFLIERPIYSRPRMEFSLILREIPDQVNFLSVETTL